MDRLDAAEQGAEIAEHVIDLLPDESSQALSISTLVLAFVARGSGCDIDEVVTALKNTYANLAREILDA